MTPRRRFTDHASNLTGVAIVLATAAVAYALVVAVALALGGQP